MAVNSSSGNCDQCQVHVSMTQEEPDTLLHPGVLVEFVWQAIKMEAKSFNDLINLLQSGKPLLVDHWELALYKYCILLLII